MKLILSTLALGTAAVSPFVQNDQQAAEAPAPEPLRLVTAALAPEPTPAVQDDEELQKAAVELEAQLADLRAELEAMRARLAEEKASGNEAREAKNELRQRFAEVRERRAEVLERAEEARQRAEEVRAMNRRTGQERRARVIERGQLARVRAQEARELAEKAREEAEAIAESVEAKQRRVIARVLGDAEGLVELELDGDGPHVIDLSEGDNEWIEKIIQLEGDGDMAEHIVKLHGNAGQWIADASGDEDGEGQMTWSIAVSGDDEDGPRKTFTKRWVTRLGGDAEGHGHDHDHGHEHGHSHDEEHEIHVFGGQGKGHAGGIHVHQGYVRGGSQNGPFGGIAKGQSGGIAKSLSGGKNVGGIGQIHMLRGGQGGGKNMGGVGQLHVLRGGPMGGQMGGISKGHSGGQTINITVEEGDVHINANGASINTSKSGANGPGQVWFGTGGGDDVKVLRKRFEKKNKKGDARFGFVDGSKGGVFVAKPEVSGKIIINGEEMDFDGAEFPGFAFADGEDGVFSYGISVMGEGDGDFEGQVQNLFGGIKGLDIDAIGDLEDFIVIDGANGLPADIEELIESKLDGFEFDDFDVDFEFDGDGPFDAEELEELIEDAVRQVEVITESYDPSNPEANDKGMVRTRIIVNGEEFEFSEEECDEDECEEECEEEEEHDGKFVFASPFGLSAGAPAAPPVPATLSYRLASNPADEDLAALAREIRAELRAMRAELAELRAHVMSAPAAPQFSGPSGQAALFPGQGAVAPSAPGLYPAKPAAPTTPGAGAPAIPGATALFPGRAPAPAAPAAGAVAPKPTQPAAPAAPRRRAR